MNKLLCYFGFHKYKMQPKILYKGLVKGVPPNKFTYYRYATCVRCGQLHKMQYLIENIDI